MMPTAGVASPASLLTMKVRGCNEFYHLAGFSSILHDDSFLVKCREEGIIQGRHRMFAPFS